MFRMQRHRGHFYNWYDTSTLEPLLPQYISTVDSGNLAGHLLTLRQGLLELADRPVYERQCLNGISDTLQVLDETLPESGKVGKSRQSLKSVLASCFEQAPATIVEAGANLRLIWNLARAFAEDCKRRDSETDFWLKLLLAQCEDMCLFVESLAFFYSAGSDDSFPQMPSLNELAGLNIDSLPEAVQRQARSAKQRAVDLIERAEQLAASLTELSNMDFAFLYDRERGLLSIGYSMQESRLDKSHYDLLASEARLAYYVGITHNQLPQESWFQLGRMMNAQGRYPVLMSWSGSMFEYLMPELVMPGFPGTILNETCLNAVRRQIAYGLRRGLPWGVSESAYNMRDAAYNYQYRAFGVPGLGLRRGLGNDYVAAPYASLLALMFLPAEACANLHDLASRGVCGRFGFYESVDYTPLRLPRGSDSAVIYSFMAHHQAMGFLGLTSLLLEKPMQRRFMAAPEFKAGALLLEEKMPRLAPDHLKNVSYLSIPNSESGFSPAENRQRVFSCADAELPAVQLLSNGNYHVMINNWGAGYSRYRKVALTRWHEDPVCDSSGMFIYIRDLQTGEYWSASRQPTMVDADSCEAVFSPARAEFKVSKNNLDVHTEIVVSPEDNAELRRLHVRNCSRVRRSVELTAYAEVALSDPMADAQHPAFSKLFVQTEIMPELQAVICSRRPRSRNEDSLHMFQMMHLHECDAAGVSYETDRARFIGRGRTPGRPAAMEQYGPLSGSQGAVLDPVAAIRCNITLNPGEICTVDFVVGVGDGREGCLRLIEKFRVCHLADRVFELAWTHSQVQLHQFNIEAGEADLYEKMAASIIYSDMARRAERAVIEANELDQSKLWRHSISGDLPIVLLRVSNVSSIELLTRVIKAHAYWRMKGLTADLIILNEDDYSYRQSLHEMIISLINSSSLPNILDAPGGVFVRATQALSREERILLEAAARMVLSDSRGSLEDQICRSRPVPALPSALSSPTGAASFRFEKLQSPRENLQFSNLYGGFGKGGREYVIRLGENASTPAPWVNVLANEGFGCIVSERGSSYTWKDNAHEFRITPWFNDPVCDPSGEALYIRDEESGIFWSPSPGPARGAGEYLIRHGFGYSIFEHISQEIESRLCLYVARNEPVKFFLLHLKNRSSRMRRLSVTGYVEWVLGDMRNRHAMHIVTAEDRATGAIFARNPHVIDFPGRVAFFDVDVPSRSITGDRLEFLGRNRSLENPAAMQRACLSGQVGGGFEPCGAVHTAFELDGGEERELVFILGGADSAEQAQRLIRRFSDVHRAKQELEQVKGWWEEILGSIQITTPDKSVDIMANGWLMYQVLASRFFARSGFYQSGGAFGYRDQLQDCMALVYAAPELVRSHLLRCAAHQFPEGDVMHWWHPPADRGVRTRCSDDYLWLPAAVEHYVRITGDFAILAETAGYVEGRPLNQDEESYYDLPSVSGLKETLYRHCVRAVRRSLARGEHGLPLIGGGDWNDGMNLVGIAGKGESVWLGFFCCRTLRMFAPLAAGQGDTEFAELCLKQAGALRESIEEYAWDGAWYRRAYFDDGTPLGSAQNAECRIDSISQSWSVLCGSTAEWRQNRAMHSLDELLVERDAGIIRLLYPPFDKSGLEPGYIKGYLPGVRENGGQYTHAAVWAAMAFAALGQGQKAWELLDILNPINHARSEAEVDIYKVEPYVLSGDVYAEPPNAGRGGWSWLTGAASWMYCLIIESLLGLHREGEKLRLQPVMPEHWDEIEIIYTYQETVYQIKIFQRTRSAEKNSGAGQMQLYLDGVEQSSASFRLVNDGMRHEVELYLHRAQTEEMQLGVD
ncbi:MAG: hypothetical protein IJD04_04805 [Desulfovibrionaceae bacterium]|nr:hypothetical protein [Desulfovibrionaceae bacterium]